ncbi:MAG: ribosomal-processing cysteine protease Prp [Spirochaetales bacterium]|nr:ribosomal-processing cysteine protease Prp [Spirochaetales bacterium]
MINADITLDSCGVLREVSTSGHSGYSHNGSDIVCAAVSAFVETGYILLRKILADNVTLVTDTADAAKNEMTYRIGYYPDELTQQMQGITLYLITGLTEIQHQYEANIRVNIK